MSRIHRTLLLAALVLTLGLTGVAGAQPQPIAVGPVFAMCNTYVYGYASTEADALANALNEAKSKYFVFSYTVVLSHCTTTEIPDPTPLDPFHTTTVTICEVKLKICGIPKAAWVLH
jgi:hypothetical protein